MKKLVSLIVAIGLLFILSGCGESMGQRTENKNACEKAGGEYRESVNIAYTYQDWYCDLSTKKED